MSKHYEKDSTGELQRGPSVLIDYVPHFPPTLSHFLVSSHLANHLSSTGRVKGQKSRLTKTREYGD